MRHSAGRQRREHGRRTSSLSPLSGGRGRCWRRCLSGTLLVWSISAGGATSADPGTAPSAATETTRATPPVRREAALQPTVPPPWPAELPPVPDPATPDPPRDALDDWQQAKERQFQRLQQQILELGRRWNGQRERTGAVSEPQADPPPVSNGDESAPPSSGAEPATTSNDLSSTTPPPLPPADQSASSPTSLPLEGPIDRLGLANSLFATGQIAAAARIYSELEAVPLTPEERAWIQFQLAACDRRSGRLSAAQQRYRDLITAGRPDWMMPLARWWLKAIDDRERLVANAAKLKSLIQQLETEVTRELQPDSGATLGADPAIRR